MNLKKIEEVEKIIINLGRELNQKAVMFKDDIANMKNLHKILENILVIEKRLKKRAQNES